MQESVDKLSGTEERHKRAFSAAARRVKKMTPAQLAEAAKK
jgi:hypothetical protein